MHYGRFPGYEIRKNYRDQLCQYFDFANNYRLKRTVELLEYDKDDLIMVLKLIDSIKTKNKQKVKYTFEG